MGALPVGTMFAIYDQDGALVRWVGVDVSTGQFLESVNLEPGQSLWIAVPGGTWMRLDTRLPVQEDDSDG